MVCRFRENKPQWLNGWVVDSQLLQKSACCCYCWKERQKAPRFRERNWKRTLQKGIKTPPERRTPVDEPILAASPVLVWQPVHKALFVRGKSVSRIGHHMNVQHNAAVVSRLKGQLRIFAGPTKQAQPSHLGHLGPRQAVGRDGIDSPCPLRMFFKTLYPYDDVAPTGIVSGNQTQPAYNTPMLTMCVSRLRDSSIPGLRMLMNTA